MSQLDDRAPELILFKHGYDPLTLRNDIDIAARLPNYQALTSRRISDLMSFEAGHPEREVQETFWDGKTITLEPFTGTPAEWLKRLSVEADRFRLGRTPLVLPEHRRALRRERAYFETPDAQQVPRKDVQAVFERIERAE